jgi:hypothetical protein
MDLQRCDICIGSGKVMGGGMIYHSCEKCSGIGKLAPTQDCVMGKDSDNYKSAKKRIKALDENLSDEEVEKILDEELGKLNDEKPKAKRRRRKPRE